MDSLDHPRVWLLAAFCVAAKNTTPEGVKWAASIAGWVRPPRQPSEIDVAALAILRPFYSVMRGNRVKVHHNTRINRLMTGLRLLVEPYSLCHLQPAEAACIHELAEFIQPTVAQANPVCRAAIELLLEETLKKRDFSDAA